MLSFKSFMQQQDKDLFDSALEAYKSSLAAIGRCAREGNASLGHELQTCLDGLRGKLAQSSHASQIRETQTEAESHLQRWAQRTSDYFCAKTAEVKEIMILLVRATEQLGERDMRNTSQLNELTRCFETIANLEDLQQVRRSIEQTTSHLRNCVNRMEQESKQSIAKLQQELASFQCRVVEAERLAAEDLLTSLSNRREVESQLDFRIRRREPFCVVFVDLNGFKIINDRYGHAAGDDLLKQFAAELQRFFRLTEVVGRWGGDEFIGIIDSDFDRADSRISGLETWLSGNYQVNISGVSRKIPLSATFGVAEWKRGDTVESMIARADADMYKKKSPRNQVSNR